MRKAIFNNRFGDTITTDEILAPVHICGQLSCAIDEDVDNSDDIEAICGEEVAEQYREALDEGDCDKARDIIDTTVFTTVEAMTFDQQIALYKKVSYSAVTFDHIEDDDTKPERPSAGIAEISAEDGFVKVEAKNDGEEYHEIAADSIRDSRNGKSIYDSYRLIWPEGEFAVSGQSYEYTKDELNNVRFDSGHEER
jgi:hypothetical protein